MREVMFGVVYGKTILLKDDPGIQEGQEVEVIVRVRTATTPEPPPGLEGIRSAAGLMADYTKKDDEILEEIYRDRQSDKESRSVAST